MQVFIFRRKKRFSQTYCKKSVLTVYYSVNKINTILPKKEYIKVISIIPDSPPYEIYGNSKKPEFVFEMDNGNWAGIWGYDWADQIGKNVTKLDKDIIFEIWQPDLRADRIYSAEISERACHKLFPASVKKNVFFSYNYSEILINEILDTRNAIFQIGLPNAFYNEILNTIKNESKIIGTIAGDIQIPFRNIFKLRKNQFRTISYIITHIRYKKYINRYNTVIYKNNTNLTAFKKLYHGKLCKITMGIDTCIFKQLDKIICRKELNLELHKKIILSGGRLSNAKQNHKLINIFNGLSDDFDFLLIFIGHGDRKYEDYLKKISEKLLKKNQILFTGYINPELLAKYYNSADLFFMSSKSEGGPVVSMEALACGTPVISTDTGNVAEFIREHTKINIVGKYDYTEWKSVLVKFLNGDDIEKINIDLVKEKYSWDTISKKFIDIYRNL